MWKSLPPLDLARSWPYWLTLTLLVAIGANHVVEGLADWHLHDMHVYHDAAMRLRAGEILYGGDVGPNTAYRYAPWFAIAWVPLTFLPQHVVWVGWSVLLLAGSWLAVRPFLRLTRANVLLVVLFAPMLFGISTGGNVQPLMIAALVWGIPRRWGWVAVGLAGSLKVVPLAYCAVFIAERRWWQAVGAVVLAGVLWLPMLWMAVEPVTFDAGLARTLPGALWLAVAGGSAVAALVLAARRSRYTPLAAGVAAVLSLPRLFVYEVAMLLPGSRNPTIRRPR